MLQNIKPDTQLVLDIGKYVLSHVAHEAVLVPIASTPESMGSIIELNETATLAVDVMSKKCDKGGFFMPRDVADAFAEAYDVESADNVINDVYGFIAMLADRGLVQPYQP